jgi:hypothetical protein
MNSWQDVLRAAFIEKAGFEHVFVKMDNDGFIDIYVVTDGHTDNV